MTHHAHLLLSPDHTGAAGALMKALGRRHIALNPVRAGIVEHPAEHPGSGYRANAQGEADLLLTPHRLYPALWWDAADGQAAYRELFRHGLKPGLVDEIRRATNGTLRWATNALRPKARWRRSRAGFREVRTTAQRVETGAVIGQAALVKNGKPWSIPCCHCGVIV